MQASGWVADVAGLTSTGFVAKTYTEVLDGIETAQKAVLGDDLDVSPEGPLGQINGIVASALRELWEQAGVVYTARSPSGASFVALEGVAEITGLDRRDATKGTVVLSATLGAGVALPAGSIAHVAGQDTNRWVTIESVINNGMSQVAVPVRAEAETAGLVRANASTITVIATPVTGWVSVTNVLDAVPGAPVETDTQLRRRRDDTIRAGGSSPLDAVARAVGDVAGVTQVRVFENTSDSVDADGRPPHSLDVIVVGGENQAIAQALWSAKAAGIETWGSTTASVTDSAGVPRSVSFSRPITVPIYVVATVERDASVYPTQGTLDTAVGAAIAAAGDPLRISEQVRAELLRSTVFRLAGITDLRALRLGRLPDPVGTANIPIGRRELADLDSSRVTVEIA